VSDPFAVRRMFDSAETAFGGIDVLVNNAGIMQLSSIARTRMTRSSTDTLRSI
jgi:3-oxoacyl-[acyl-carrier protein] reductase